MKRAALLLRCSTNIQDYNRQKLELEKVASRFKLKVAKVFGEHVTGKDDIRKGNRKSVDELIDACWKIQCKLPPKTKRFCPLVLK